jgi:hypothetical protein
MPAHLARLTQLRVAAVSFVLAVAPLWADAQNHLSSSAAIDAYLSGVVRDTRIPGIVALVADADRVLYTGAFGRQDVAGGVPMANDTIFRIASMTKPVTSVAVMMLVQGWRRRCRFVDGRLPGGGGSRHPGRPCACARQVRLDEMGGPDRARARSGR